ncbi:hypothetical protein SBA3_1860041 [Candidatus Sulfopaludibacter sp. SbA3]|nr:hypothetical protein SBA3_1860041 [Candidatus Sulfopaludibacter sp. SbA3]
MVWWVLHVAFLNKKSRGGLRLRSLFHSFGAFAVMRLASRSFCTAVCARSATRHVR